jgi:hypothetical protein
VGLYSLHLLDIWKIRHWFYIISKNRPYLTITQFGDFVLGHLCPWSECVCALFWWTFQFLTIFDWTEQYGSWSVFKFWIALYVTVCAHPSPCVPSLLLPTPTQFLGSTFLSLALKCYFTAQVKYIKVLGCLCFHFRSFFICKYWQRSNNIFCFYRLSYNWYVYLICFFVINKLVFLELEGSNSQLSIKSVALSSATFGQQLSVLKPKLWQTITPESLRYQQHSHKTVQSISEHIFCFSIWWDPLVWSLL